jgi:glucosylglycerate phosphorylase
MDKVRENLIFLYGQDQGEATYKELQTIIQNTQFPKIDPRPSLFSEKDITMITYGNAFHEPEKPTLQTLNTFLSEHITDSMNTVHVLPFHPDGLDRGFSVVDFYRVKEGFGDWPDIESIAQKYNLMADLVLNHVAAEHDWFQKFLAGEEQYKDYFISYNPEDLTDELKSQLSKVFRPRSSPLLTPFDTKNGKRFVWTTFSVGGKTDQVDLNYRNPKVLLEMLQVFFFQIQKGVRVFRMDAVTYVWKELGTSCVHLPQGHAILQIFRSLLDTVCPGGLIITETNVPHKENISYYGDGENQAHMVYNFALPPLTLHAIYTGNAAYLSEWATTLTLPSDKTAFFNFLASHDGIGILGARGVLPDDEIEKIFETIIDHGTRFGYKDLPDGQRTIYEMCATWWSAVSKDEVPFEETLQKVLMTHAICFALAGVPAVYYLSLIGKANDIEAFNQTGHIRDILRTNVDYAWLNDRLIDPNSKEAKVFSAMKELIKERTSHPAFHPNAAQEILALDTRVFALLRKSENERLLALHNVSQDHVTVEFENKSYDLKPYGYLWVTL